jgi:hypothetical protein
MRRRALALLEKPFVPTAREDGRRGPGPTKRSKLRRRGMLRGVMA